VQHAVENSEQNIEKLREEEEKYIPDRWCGGKECFEDSGEILC
jgi:hypothetical protein